MSLCQLTRLIYHPNWWIQEVTMMGVRTIVSRLYHAAMANANRKICQTTYVGTILESSSQEGQVVQVRPILVRELALRVMA